MDEHFVMDGFCARRAGSGRRGRSECDDASVLQGTHGGSLDDHERERRVGGGQKMTLKKWRCRTGRHYSRAAKVHVANAQAAGRGEGVNSHLLSG